MLNYLSPQIELRHVPTMMKRFTTGTLIAGVYDITGSCTIRCPIQPHSSNLRSSNSINLLMQISGGTDRFVAGTIGFLATWLVGSYYTWFLAERCWPVQDSDSAQFPNHSRNSNRFRDRSFCCDHWVCLRTLD